MINFPIVLPKKFFHKTILRKKSNLSRKMAFTFYSKSINIIE
jgi:hypothetical protein